ncbi:MAG: lipid A biosynthesis acyltransferase [Bacteroidetes bacterium CG02_land_8_20_14_3_00_31_25]|nr:lipid A biosynthesis acyltransferase [Bacteroidota bacterium]PIV58031.1 MAG: lipid A biosynthesis acyltransferase [Bacteroidetes bacterium CG02_land_8_20_14_3_00_31_25]PIX35694.1 MAG: lipid A biosynthesis acyltransferase [Bacteroidetes bacterium CG_4_8_14_3_um_filter_31_14]PIY02071.1 MAG: lipid A biosynthesis acyltransferase [Bacteroidetes bacterium CG_4_10_14_3_um_filter_31_20]
MVTWKGKTRGNTLGYRIFIFILKTFGLSASYFSLKFVALYFFFFSRKSYNALYFFYSRVFGYSKIKTSKSILKNFINLGETLLDKTAFMAGYKTNFKFDFEGENYLRDMANNTGGILISAHIGNFEMAANMLERINTKINLVVLDAEQEKIKNLLDNILQQKVNLIPLKSDMSHLFLINNAIKNKEIICIHGDRFIDGERTIKFDFMKRKALFPAGPFHLALLYKVPVSFVFAMKDSNYKYHFYASKPKIYNVVKDRANRNSEILGIINDYINELEKMVKLYPLQWFNHYQFWKN